MQQIDLKLEDKALEEHLRHVFEQIDDGELEEDDYIIEDVQNILNEMNESDRNNSINYMNLKYRNRDFLQNGKFKLEDQSLNIDYVQFYQDLRKSKQSQQMSESIKNDWFCEQNLIPQIIQQNIRTLAKLDDKLFDLLDISQKQQNRTLNKQFEFLKSLIQLIYNQRLANEEQKKLEIILGSLIKNQIYEFQYFLEKIQQKNKQQYQDFTNLIQNIQIKINKEKQEIQDQILQNKNFEFLFSLFTLDVKENKFRLNNFLASQFEIQIDQLKLETIIEKIEQFIIKGFDFMLIYFRVLWYLWIQYFCSIDSISKTINTDNLKEKQDEAERKKILIRQQNTFLKKKEGDLIVNFLIHTFFFFNYENDDQSEIYRQLKMQFFQPISDQTIVKVQSLEELIEFKEEEFCKFWQQISNFSYIQLFQFTQESKILQELIIFFWLNQLEKQVQMILRYMLKLNVKFDFHQWAALINVTFPGVSNYFIINMLFILTKIQKEFDDRYFEIFFKYFKKTQKFDGCSELFQSISLIQKKKLSYKDIKNLAKIENFEQIAQFWSTQEIQILIKLTLDQYLSYNLVKYQPYITFFVKAEKLASNSEELKCLIILLKQIDHKELHSLIQDNLKKPLEISVVDKTLSQIRKVYTQLKDDNQNQQIVFFNLKYFISHSFYNFQLLYKLLNEGHSEKTIFTIIKVFYLSETGDGNSQKFKDICLQIFNQNQDLYNFCFKPVKYFNQILLKPIGLKKYQSQTNYPYNIQITLEDFNISSFEMKDSQQDEIIQWIQETSNVVKFRKFIPIYFNIIKRDNCSEQLLKMINSKKANGNVNYNSKSLFQIVFNNCNDELQTMILKLRSQFNSVPLIFYSQCKEIKQKIDLFLINNQIYYIFPPCFTIINFSLSRKNSKIGKTQLINKLFYESQPFETSDTSAINENTADIFFDFSFNGSRDFSVTDVHGKIPSQIYEKILPFFQLWIVQMDSERELQENFEEMQKFQQIRKQFFPQVCFIVRNSRKNLQEVHAHLINEIIKNEIKIYFIQNLNEYNLDEQVKKREVDEVSIALMNQINNIVQQAKMKTRNDFLKIIEQFSPNCQTFVKKILAEEEIVQKIENQLVEQAQKEQSNDNQVLIQQQSKFQEISKSNDKQMFKDNQFILEQFSEILKLDNNYILYSLLVDKIRKFNQQLSKQLTLQKEEINNKVNEIKQKKKCLQKDAPESDDFRAQIQSLENESENLEKNNRLKNIGVEFFWREIIFQTQQGSLQTILDPPKICYSMMNKGEPFELLNGDTYDINDKFLQSLVQQFEQKGKEKILVLGILGPQSTGKSTVLNKIFGCHFWTSAGRCTKGVYMQILKIDDKEQFDNLFDYILLLDTEGLQNPNQVDADFDKKIALFILLISDIIIINVKGEINQQFKKLVEMCIYTLGQMNQKFEFQKQLSWCFNQNTDAKNYEIFLKQIESISENLNSNNDSDEQKIDYQEVLDITKRNVQVLGISHYETNWKFNQYYQQQDCKQLLQNNLFSSEAYQYGISIIQNFILKLKSGGQQQKDLQNQQIIKEHGHFQDLQNFLANIKDKWKSIQSLPDLLEFTELIQHQQNSQVKIYFDKILTDLEKQFPDIQTIKIGIEKLIDDEKQNRTKEFFKGIQQDQEKLQEQKLKDLQIQAEDKISNFRRQKKISKKITKKYIKQLEYMIIGYINEYKSKIFEIVSNKQREYERKRGIESINQFVQDLYKQPEQLQNFQLHQNKITGKFDELWSKIVKDVEDQQNQLFDEFQANQYIQITQMKNEYILATNHAEEYKSFFLSLNKCNPDDNRQESKMIFQIFSKELAQQQFTVIDKHIKNIRYFDIFSQNVQQKIKSSHQQDLIHLQNFYKYQVTYSYCSSGDINYYLENGFFEDMQEHLIFKQQQTVPKIKINDFFIFLTQFKIDYDQKKYDQLVQKILQINKTPQNSKLDIKEEIQQLKKSFQHNYQTSKVIIVNQQFLSILKIIYKKMVVYIKYSSYDFETERQLNENKEKFLQQNIILSEDVRMVPLNEKTIFKFILNSSSNVDQSDLLSEIPNNFRELMDEYQGWQKLYDSIYQIVKNEVYNPDFKRAQQNIEDNEFDEENLKEKKNIQASILKTVELKIAEYNNQFASYGVLLNQIGQRCIYYYCKLLIWRFGCLKKHQIFEKHSKRLQSDREKNFIQFKNDILQDKVKQSQLKAKNLVDFLKSKLINLVILEQRNEALNYIQNRKINSFQLIKKLDQELLEKDLSKFYKNKDLQNKIISYIINQQAYIKNYAEKGINQIQIEIQTIIKENTQKQRKKIIEQLEKIQYNADQISNKIDTDTVQMKNHFNLEEKKIQEESFYEQQLFLLVFSCLIGEKNPIIFHTIDYGSQKFFTDYLKKIDIVINEPNYSASLKEIQNLKTFVEAVILNLKSEIQKIQTEFVIQLNQLQLTNELNDSKIQMIGCLESCPVCNRKCDLQNDDHAQHECRNGHQLRGMNAVLIGNVPSLFICEEMQNDFIIKDETVNRLCKWSQIQKKYPKWNFRGLEKEQIDRLSKVWNGGIGILVCEHLKVKLNKPVYFREKNIFDSTQENSHYIFMLDASSGMKRGNQFSNGEEAVKNCIKKLKQNLNALISVITFDDDTKVKIDRQPANQAQVQSGSFIWWCSGSVNYDKAFQQVFQFLQEEKKYSRTIIFLYTNGEGPYPKNTIKKIQEMNEKTRSTITLIIFTQARDSQVLSQIVIATQQYIQEVQIFYSITGREIEVKWGEVVSGQKEIE